MESPTGLRRRDTRFWLVTILVGAVFFGFLGAWFKNRSHTDILSFPPIEVDGDRLERQRAKKYGDVDVDYDTTKVEKLLDAVKVYNVETIKGVSRPRREKLRQRVFYHANEIVVETGYNGFMKIGEISFQKCQTGLKEVLKALRTGELEWDTAIDEPPRSEYSDYRNYCGRALPSLSSFGLIRKNGRWRERTDAGVFFDLWQRYRWATIIRDLRVPYALMTDYGVKLWFRWRVEEAKGLSLEEKLRLVEKGRDYLPYPVPYAKALLNTEAGYIGKAISILEDWDTEKSQGNKYDIQKLIARLKALKSES